ncbi:Nucleic acid-binding, OB-fold [Sesbania bispinosa]|nr:Nucleic acid-binding, OB-fold [Sesbania bispinosa]
MAVVSGQFHTIKDIFEGMIFLRLKVRVVRMWKSCSKNEPDKPFAIELVFVDAEGGRIQASIQKPMMRKFMNIIAEGEVYKMNSFSIVKNDGIYRATRHQFKLIFNSKTKVFPVESQLIPEFGLSLVSSDVILSTKGESPYLFDMMGILTTVSEKKNIKKEGTTTRFIVLELVDDKGKIRCALFGDYVDIVKEHLAITGTELPVVIIQFAKVNLYKGEVGLINLFNTSRLLWNPQIPEAIQFKQSLAVHEIEVDLAIGDSPVNIRGDFLNYFSRKTIEALQVCEKDGFFIVLGTITAILEDGKWSYSACSCNKSVNVLNKESKGILLY